MLALPLASASDKLHNTAKCTHPIANHIFQNKCSYSGNKLYCCTHHHRFLVHSHESHTYRKPHNQVGCTSLSHCHIQAGIHSHLDYSRNDSSSNVPVHCIHILLFVSNYNYKVALASPSAVASASPSAVASALGLPSAVASASPSAVASALGLPSALASPLAVVSALE